MMLRRFVLLFALPAAAAFACSSHATPPPTSPTSAASTATPTAKEHAFRAAVDALAHQIHAPKDSIVGVSQDEMTWPDSCLGCAKAGESCAQVVTPGYRVVLRVSDATYEYHTNLGGTARLCSQSPGPASGNPPPPPAPTPYR